MAQGVLRDADEERVTPGHRFSWAARSLVRPVALTRLYIKQGGRDPGTTRAAMDGEEVPGIAGGVSERGDPVRKGPPRAVQEWMAPVPRFRLRL